MERRKQRIAGRFSRFANTYEQYAEVQRSAAAQLAAEFAGLAAILPPGPLLELGCGTGLLSTRLLDVFPERVIFFSDLAPGMVEFCRQKLSSRLAANGRHHFQVLDGENPPPSPRYALIVSSLTMQWFADLESSIARLLAALTPGGYLLFSVVGANTFSDWRRLCSELALPCTINPFPALAAVVEMVGGRSVSCRREEELRSYPSAREFFRSLQRIGAGTSLAAPPLSPGQLRTLIRAWDERSPEGVAVNYEIIYAVLAKE